MYGSGKSHAKQNKHLFCDDQIHKAGSSARSCFQSEASSLLCSKESSTIFKQDYAARNGNGLHHLEVGLAAPSDNASSNFKPGAATMTESQAHRLSHNETALIQMNDGQLTQVVQSNPTAESVEKLVDRDQQQATELLKRQTEVMSAVMNSDNIDENFKDKIRRDVIGA